MRGSGLPITLIFRAICAYQKAQPFAGVGDFPGENVLSLILNISRGPVRGEVAKAGFDALSLSVVSALGLSDVMAIWKVRLIGLQFTPRASG